MKTCMAGCWLLLATLALLPSHAQNYPNRPVRVLVPLSAGGGMDTVARGLGQRLGDVLGQSFVVDNRPGAGSQIALEILAAAAPDGHTLMMISATTDRASDSLQIALRYRARFRAGLAGQRAGLRARRASGRPREIGRGAGAVPARKSRQAQLRLVRHRQPDSHDR